jgi:hypothetical protein
MHLGPSACICYFAEDNTYAYFSEGDCLHKLLKMNLNHYSRFKENGNFVFGDSSEGPLLL